MNKESRAFDKVIENVAQACARLDRTVERHLEAGIEVNSIVFRPPDDKRSEWLVVVRVTIEGTKKVGFHRAEMFVEAVKGTSDRLHNGSITWKDDRYGN